MSEHDFRGVMSNDAVVCSRCGVRWLWGAEPTEPCRSPDSPHDLEAMHRLGRKCLNCTSLEEQLQEAMAARDAAERTVKSIATMLGWMNVPPQDVLEAEIRALKARAARTQVGDPW